jgi:hypothetical protein
MTHNRCQPQRQQTRPLTCGDRRTRVAGRRAAELCLQLTLCDRHTRCKPLAIRHVVVRECAAKRCRLPASS